MNDEERIRAYMRGRADVSVPDDLGVPTGRPVSGRWSVGSGGILRGLVAAALVLVVVAVGASVRQPSSSAPAGPSGSPHSGVHTPTPGRLAGSFPTEINGLPVISVAQTLDLLRSGALEGHAVAVAGYFDSFAPSCPYPGRYIGPLESWCDLRAFADTPAGARVCQPMGENGVSCSQPAGTVLVPFFMDETSGNAYRWSSGANTWEPAALVLIGHAGDPRQWACTPWTQFDCANAFVVDRVAWSQGQDVPLAAPETGDLVTGAPLTPMMTLDQAAAAAGVGEEVVTGAVFQAGGLAAIDPRWNLAGLNLVWLLRTIELADSSPGAQERAERVWLVDDADGKVLDSKPLKLDPSYQPARFWQIATVHGIECCAGDERAFERVESDGGTVVYDGPVSGGAFGSSEATDTTTFGGGYGSRPLLLVAGEYSITVWVATSEGGATGPPTDSCSTELMLAPIDVVTLSTDIRVGTACTFSQAPSPTAVP